MRRCGSTVRDLRAAARRTTCRFDVRAGEIVGLAGLVGAGTHRDRARDRRRRRRDRRRGRGRRQAGAAARHRAATSTPASRSSPKTAKRKGSVLGMTRARKHDARAPGRLLARTRSSIARASARRPTREIAELHIRTPEHRTARAEPLRRQPAEGRAREVADSAMRACFSSTNRRAASTSARRRRSTA